MSNLQQHIEKEWKHLANKKIFLACSGGVDSMTLLHIFIHAKWQVEVMHVNYHLRGEDSNLDQQLVEKTCSDNTIPFHLKSIKLQDLLDEKGGNLQEVARNVRYDFFEEKRIHSENNYIALGQHLDDQIETFFMHLGRKSGIMGMACMPNEHQRFVRPLLPFSKEEIIEYAESNGVKWREDYSNKTNKYKRNILRNIILPELHIQFPDLKTSITTLINAFQSTQKELENKISPICLDIILSGELSFEKFDVLSQEEKNELLRQLGQKPGLLIDLEKIRNAQKGKKIKLEKSTDCQFDAIYNEKSKFLFISESKNRTIPKIKIEKIDQLPTSFTKDEIYIDLQTINGEFQLRKWKTGDRMKPIGLEGSKLISDIIKDAKVPTAEKENIFVLTDNDKILWCIGLRVSALSVAKETSTEIVKISLDK